ncbi:hypothetical protein [Mycobacterium sp. 1081908.1]|uniref:hypothetical protein n=1 Tax=Mycobacterium sp. 1081908.1 TaxID=1834066 RepID=UPI0007FF91EA|nr:hypothetical protein [Mycobacterium sp. 1081908.1]OBK52373.1 hypothetical protein A5655_21860 [Mycobacterium sp. 1081908.1]
MDDRAESDLAWELADLISPALTDRDRSRFYAAIGSGECYTAIDTALQTMAQQGAPITSELITKLTEWLGAYAHSADAPRLHELLRVIKSAGSAPRA